MQHKDITSRDHIELLVNEFYDRVKKDALLGPQFSHVDWTTHLPIMYRFWSSVILGEQSYRGNPLQKHVNLPLSAEHFAAWIKLFIQVVDDHYQGEHADETKMRAQGIAMVFQHKMKISSKPD
jgi:hemoglobin